MLDLEATMLLAKRFGKHELSHPVDALVAVGNSEVVGLAMCRLDSVVATGHELERESGSGVEVFLLVAELEVFEGSCNLVIGRRGCTSDAIVVNVDAVEHEGGESITLVHSELRAMETEMGVLPLMTQELCLAFLHITSM